MDKILYMGEPPCETTFHVLADDAPVVEIDGYHFGAGPDRTIWFVPMAGQGEIDRSTAFNLRDNDEYVFAGNIPQVVQDASVIIGELLSTDPETHFALRVKLDKLWPQYLAAFAAEYTS